MQSHRLLRPHCRTPLAVCQGVPSLAQHVVSEDLPMPPTMTPHAFVPPGADEAELKKRTLTNLYNRRPTWLDNAHTKLDQVVLDAYSWPHDLSDEEILARLLALNGERAAAQGGAVVASCPLLATWARSELR